MIFQLCSHSHLYEDTAAGTYSRKYSKKFPKKKKMKGKENANPVPPLPTGGPGALEPPQRRSRTSESFPHSLSSAPGQSGVNSLRELSPQTTARLTYPGPRGSPNYEAVARRNASAISVSSEATLTEGEEHPNPLGQEVMPDATNDKATDVPQLSWFMTVSVLTVVIVVRTKLAPCQ